MVQPQAQPAAVLVELDQWVRGGGHVLLLADPALEWPSERPFGDPLRPPLAYPETPKIPVNETYHDVTVADPYRWLENDAAATVKQWSTAQNALSRRYLDGLPQRAALGARVGRLMQSEPVDRYAFQFRKLLFALKRQPPRNQPLLVAMKPTAAVASEHTVVDPLADDPSGRTTIDFYRPSHDGRHVAVSLSRRGLGGPLHGGRRPPAEPPGRSRPSRWYRRVPTA